MVQRCQWAGNDPLYTAYHDQEWGVPVYEDRLLFEFLILEGMQAGLSWITILKKRQNYRLAFDNFDPEKIAGYDPGKKILLLQNPGIIRNRLKIDAAVQNAREFMRVCQEFGSFANYIWQFVEHQPRVNHWQNISEIPGRTKESDAMSADLKKRGFKFIGSTICYAFMQAVGMVNDHTVSCFRHQEIISSISG